MVDNQGHSTDSGCLCFAFPIRSPLKPGFHDVCMGVDRSWHYVIFLSVYDEISLPREVRVLGYTHDFLLIYGDARSVDDPHIGHDLTIPYY